MLLNVRPAIRNALLLLPALFIQQVATGAVAVRTIAEAHRVTLSGQTEVVRLRGVVTAFSGWKNSYFLQDSTGAISVDRQEDAAVKVGDEVEVAGNLQAGFFANVLSSQTTNVVGRGVLPRAHEASYRELLTGELDSTLVQVTGTVRALRVGSIWGKQRDFLDVQMGEEAITVYLPIETSSDWGSLVDSQVRIRGVCGTIFNSRRQLVGVRLFVGAREQIEVLNQGPALAAIPVSRIDSLFTYHGPALDHRVHLRGTVTYQASGREVFLQEGEAAIRVLTPAPQLLTPGTQVEAWGFVNRGAYSLDLENAMLQATGTGPPPVPVHIHSSDVIKVDNGFLEAPYDGRLVQLQAKIVDRLPNVGSLLWTLEADGVRFAAQVAEAPRDWAVAFESGADVRVTGICVAELEQSKNLKSFHMLLRSPADMVVVHEPYWNQSFLLLLGTYLSILLGSVLIYLLQRWQFTGPVLHGARENSVRLTENCLRVSKILAILTMAVGFAIFAVSFNRGNETQTNGVYSGLAFYAAGTAVWLSGRTSRIARLTKLMCTWLVIVTGGWALVVGIARGNVFSSGWGITNNEEMPLSNAVSLVLVGLAILWTRASKRWADAGQVLAVMVAFTTLLKLVSALYGAGTGNGMALHLIMSTPSAIGFLSLSVALLLASAQTGLMKTVCSPRLGGLVLRRLIPVAVVVPIILGWIRLELQLRGLIDTRFGLTLFALSNALCFCFLIWASAAILNRLDAEKSKAEEGLREREQKLELVFETGSLGDWVWNIEDNRVAAHSSVWRLYGAPERRGSESIDWFSERQHPDDRERVTEELKKAQLNRQPLGIEFRVIWPDQSVHWVYCRAVPVMDEHGKLRQMTGIDLDITRQKMAEHSLKHSLDEKRALLQEVHHRVKNNLCIISSLLSMQAEQLENRDAVAKLHDSRERVMSMAMIHEQLYQHDDMSSINLADYVQELAGQLFSTYASNPNVTYRLEAQPAKLSIEQSIPCGLILNELITNALKYAYPEGSGEILIRVGAEQDQVWFTVADDGVGLPGDFDWKESKSLGMQIIHALTDQLDGDLEIRNGKRGAAFTVRFARLDAGMVAA